MEVYAVLKQKVLALNFLSILEGSKTIFLRTSDGKFCFSGICCSQILANLNYLLRKNHFRYVHRATACGKL